MEYICPQTREILTKTKEGLRRGDGLTYYFLQDALSETPSFLNHSQLTAEERVALASYDTASTKEIYRNFLDWMFASFKVNEAEFRASLIDKMRLKKKDRVLITSVGFGDDLAFISDAVGPEGNIYAQDISQVMVRNAQETYKAQGKKTPIDFSVSNALHLPFADDYFDAVFQFGGINLFGDIAKAVGEMDRVTKPGGRVVFGDEAVAPWLRDTEYGRIAICNNPLWGYETPLHALPATCVNAECTWVLGNCFYVASFESSALGPYMDIDLPHKGWKGGSARTRYFGKLEGVTQASKEKVIADAKARGVSVHSWLEDAIAKKLEK